MNDTMIKNIDIDGVKYYSAYFGCPVCLEKDAIAYPPLQWEHYSCQEKLLMGSDATLYCPRCGQKVKIMDVRFACPHHSDVKNGAVFFPMDSVELKNTSTITMLEAFMSSLPIFEFGYGGQWIRSLYHHLLTNNEI